MTEARDQLQIAPFNFVEQLVGAPEEVFALGRLNVRPGEAFV